MSTMEINDFTRHPVFISLRDKFKNKYELAAANCWTICIPPKELFKNLINTDDFFDGHILKPVPELADHYVSTDPQESRVYKFDGDVIKFVEKNDGSSPSSAREVKILNLNTEKGCDKLEGFTVVFIDRLLYDVYTDPRASHNSAERKFNHPKVSHDTGELKLNNSITSYREALDFLYQVLNICNYSLADLKDDIKSIDIDKYESANELGNVIQEWIKRHWAKVMNLFNLNIQSDGRFQKLLSLSLEIFIMNHLHTGIYSLLSDALNQDDLCIKEKIDKLISLGVTPDQLGVKEAFAISMPSAIVELATLDARRAPFEKFICLKSTLDLVIAEVKGALADIESQIDPISHADDKDLVSADYFKMISTDDFTSLLVYVIVKSRPRRLITDLHYIENFLWTTSPLDGLTHTIVTYKNALHWLSDVNPDDLPSRSSKVRNELPITEVLDVVSKHDDHSDSTPIDRQVRELATMIEKCTRTSDN